MSLAELWHDARDGAVATGSHLDSVPDGGGYDGGLGVVAALAAVDLFRDKDFHPERPVVLAVFTEEEGARFRVAVRSAALRFSSGCGVTLSARQESYTPPVRFGEGLQDRTAAVLDAAGMQAPVLSTGTGPAELAGCEAGVRALALVLEDLKS